MRYIKPETFGMESSKKMSENKYYPSISFNLDQIPEAKNWEVGKEYEVEMTLKMTSLSKRENEKGSVSFEVKAICCGEEKSKSKEEE